MARHNVGSGTRHVHCLHVEGHMDTSDIGLNCIAITTSYTPEFSWFATEVWTSPWSWSKISCTISLSETFLLIFSDRWMVVSDLIQKGKIISATLGLHCKWGLILKFEPLSYITPVGIDITHWFGFCQLHCFNINPLCSRVYISKCALQCIMLCLLTPTDRNIFY